jgi:hypothetical protein
MSDLQAHDSRVSREIFAASKEFKGYPTNSDSFGRNRIPFDDIRLYRCSSVVETFLCFPFGCGFAARCSSAAKIPSVFRRLLPDELGVERDLGGG